MLEAGLLASLPGVAKKLVTTYQCDLAYASGFIDRLAVAAVRASAGQAIARSRSVVVLAADYARASPVLRHAAERIVEVTPPIKNLDAPLVTVDRPADAGPAIGFLGRFVEEKGIDVLLDAAPAILRRFPNAMFRLAGAFEGIAGGSVLPRLQAKIEALGSSVVLLGRLPDEALPSFYASLNLFVLPSTNAYEAFGMVQAEAMAQGTPVVASDLPGVRRTVQMTGVGALARPGDAQGLADAVVDVLKQPPSRSLVRQRALAVFSNERFLDDYERLLAGR
jgi:glycosyltransferase involved in cell wall biosynthesis